MQLTMLPVVELGERPREADNAGTAPIAPAFSSKIHGALQIFLRGGVTFCAACGGMRGTTKKSDGDENGC